MEPDNQNFDPNAVTVKRDLGEHAESDGADSGANLDSIAGALAGDAPEPNDAAIAADRAERAERQREYADLRDSDGNSFDPGMHVTDADGAPKLTAKGKLRKRPGRKSAVSPSNATQRSQLGGIPGAGQPGTMDSITPEQRLQARTAGVSAANALITLGVSLGGDEWSPQKDDRHGIDEKAQLESAFANYFEAKNMRDIPPGVALSIAVSAYALPRFTMPKTQKRALTLKEKIGLWWHRRKQRKTEDVSRVDNRTDRERENNDSKGTVPKNAEENNRPRPDA